VEALRVVTALVHPIIPEATARIWEQLGLGEIQQLDLRQLAWGQIQAGTMLGKVEAVFPRADKSMIERMQQMEQQRSEPTPSANSGQAPSPKEGE
jgi:methionyl-tRNA synthetase